MPKLIVRSEPIPRREIELKPGANIFGRHPVSDCVIDDPSVSGEHCEVTVTDGLVHVKDLGSTSGTFIDGQRVEDHDLQPDQALRLGSVEMILKSDISSVSTSRVSQSVFRAEPAPADPPLAPPIHGVEPESGTVIPVGSAVCVNHPEVRATLICKKCHQLFCSACVLARHVGAKPMSFCRACGDECVLIGQYQAKQNNASRNFYGTLPAAFLYPFKRDGIILLIGGTIMFGVLHLAQFVIGGLVSLLVMVTVGGYMSAYLQRIIVTSAQGESGMPDWPDFSSVWDDIISPFLKFLSAWVVCLLPVILCGVFAPESLLVLRIAALVLGLVYFPMALLAVAMYDTVAALNPMLIIPSMFRVPLAYFVMLLLLVVIVGATVGLEVGLEKLIDVPFLPKLIMEFLSLYFFAVAMRIIGLLYYCEEDRLKWRF